MSERFLKWATKRYLKEQGYQVRFSRIRLGNFEVDGEATGANNEKVAIEIKSKNDDICRGVGQLAEARAFGYGQVILGTTLKRAKRLDSKVFEYFRIRLLGIDGTGRVHELTAEEDITPTKLQYTSLKDTKTDLIEKLLPETTAGFMCRGTGAVFIDVVARTAGVLAKRHKQDHPDSDLDEVFLSRFVYLLNDASLHEVIHALERIDEEQNRNAVRRLLSHCD